MTDSYPDQDLASRKENEFQAEREASSKAAVFSQEDLSRPPLSIRAINARKIAHQK
jgi:hypothetical protein